MQQQMLAALRDQFGVTDDSEWKIISDKITAVSDLRRSVGGGGGGFGGLRGGGNRGGRGAVANPEQDALRQAITDKLPDAEIKSRLAHLREVRKANEEKLTKAQEDLRGVLSVRQEAVAVMAGLLP
jgi:tRNA(Ile2) C34 agmatinyltransferase TiaS